MVRSVSACAKSKREYVMGKRNKHESEMIYYKCWERTDRYLKWDQNFVVALGLFLLAYEEETSSRNIAKCCRI